MSATLVAMQAFFNAAARMIVRAISLGGKESMAAIIFSMVRPALLFDCPEAVQFMCHWEVCLHRLAAQP